MPSQRSPASRSPSARGIPSPALAPSPSPPRQLPTAGPTAEERYVSHPAWFASCWQGIHAFSLLYMQTQQSGHCLPYTSGLPHAEHVHGIHACVDSIYTTSGVYAMCGCYTMSGEAQDAYMQTGTMVIVFYLKSTHWHDPQEPVTATGNQ